MICTACGHVNGEGAHACAGCGVVLESRPHGGASVQCSSCGATVFESPCKYCGARVDIPFAAAREPPRHSRRADDDDDVEDEARRIRENENKTPMMIGLGVAMFVVVAIVAGGVAESKHHKRQTRDTSSHDTHDTHSTTTTTPVATPPRFQDFALSAVVTSSQGLVPFSEKFCDVRITPKSQSKNCRVWITCGLLRVYGSESSYVQCGSSGTPTFLSDPDPTPTDGDAQLHADLTANAATLSDTNIAGESYSVSFRLQPTNALSPPAPPPFTTATFPLAVTSKVGTPPFSGSSCTLSVSPLDDPDRCRVFLNCGGKNVYGSNTSTTRCEASDKGPVLLTDYRPTPKDNDAKLQANLTRGTVALADTNRSGNSYLVTFRVTK